MMIKSDIVNVVATAALNQRINLEKIKKFEAVFHDSKVYGGRVAYFKTNTMRGKVSIFPSGKMISIGTKSEEEAFQELEDTKNFLVNEDFIDAVTIEPIVRNMVVCVDFGKMVNLESLAFEENVIYEPEQFPSGILRIAEPYKATVLIFASGKTVITGLTNAKQIEMSINTIKKLLLE